MLVHVYSGLMSRCNVIAQAVRLINENNDKELTLVWPLEKDCHIRYRDVFSKDSLGGIKVRVIEYKVFKATDLRELAPDPFKVISEFCRRFVHNCFKKKLERALEGKTFVDFAPPPEVGWEGKSFENFMSLSAFKVKEIVKKEGTAGLAVHAFSDILFVGTESGHASDESVDETLTDLSCIRFRKDLVSEAECLIPAGDTIGLHIRRTDHAAATEISSTDGFIIAIEKEIEADPNVRFFLATDSPEEENNLKERFGDRIIVQQDKSWGREDKASMRSGILDMLCLSGCKKIYGSYKSAFSEFAARYGGIELIVVSDR
ncbi:MAG: hypothetical protein K5888_06020 [Lachnospiraceae bacterium]|nr:hypothetical protein [Lachnospiraceae bacterium]